MPLACVALGCSDLTENSALWLCGTFPYPSMSPTLAHLLYRPHTSQLKSGRLSLAAPLRKLWLLALGVPKAQFISTLCKLLKSAKGEGKDSGICGQSTSIGNRSLYPTEV